MSIQGIIFANIYDSSLGELTNKRTMASLPYGGRYRQIDFTLSNMSNAGIRRIGIISRYNYQSLMAHIGSGDDWDLDLQEGGLEYLTPFSLSSESSYRGKIEALNSVTSSTAATMTMWCWPIPACCATWTSRRSWKPTSPAAKT